MTKPTRAYHKTDVGVISEASKDSKDVGVSMELASVPLLKNVRGDKKEINEKELTFANVLSIPSLNAPASTTDDPKRVGFVNVQSKHTVSMSSHRVLPVRTGYEAVIPFRVSEDYAYVSREKGVVEKITKKEITVRYKNDEVVSYKLGAWTGKEEAGVSYSHNLVTPLSVGDKINPSDVVTYDETFFELDFFNNKSIVMKNGTTINVALKEIAETYEDSMSLYKEKAKDMKVKYNKIKSFIVNKDDNMLELVKKGQKLKPSTVLFTKTVALGDSSVETGYNEETLNMLKSLSNLSPKAKVDGVINKIIVNYNCELEECSKSIQEAIKLSDKELPKKFTGKTNGTYSSKGRPLLEGEVEFKIYITVEDEMGFGDKAVFSNQLKATVGNIYSHEIRGEDGILVEGIFSLRSIVARVVNSPMLIGTTTSILEKIGQNAVEIYDS